MVIILKNDITDKEKQNIKTVLAAKSFKINEIVGEESTILAAVGRAVLDAAEVTSIPGVARVIPISKPYKLASREFKPEDTIVEIKNQKGQIIRLGGARVVVIAGPGNIESKDQIFETARIAAQNGASLLKADAYNQKVNPYGYAGLGEKGLDYLKAAGEKYGLPVVSEVASVDNLIVMKDKVDVFSVAPKDMQNYDLLKKIGELGKPVILKRDLSATLEEFLMSAEYLLSIGCDKVILCECGIRTFDKSTRNTLDLSAVPVLSSMTHLPIIVDPGCALGMRDKIPTMGLSAVAAGATGLIVTVHPEPEKALVEAGQSLYPAQFEKMMQDIEILGPVVGKEVVHIRQERKPVESGSAKKMFTCAYNGEKGAYAEQAVEDYFGDKVEAVSVTGFGDIFQSVVDGKADFGMVPIENSTAGSVYKNYDNFVRFEDVSIVGAITLKVKHALLAPKGASLETIKAVYSHPQAIDQSGRFLGEHKDWTIVDTVSTASAAVLVSEKGTKDVAAIANARNAQLYNLEVIKDGVQNNESNFTRFVIITANHVINNAAEKKMVFQEGRNPNRASIMFSTKNEPGTLFNCLSVFKKNGINMNRLESRPIPSQPWKYRFYTDIVLEEKSYEKQLDSVTKELKKCTEDLRILGVYAE